VAYKSTRVRDYTESLIKWGPLWSRFPGAGSTLRNVRNGNCERQVWEKITEYRPEQDKENKIKEITTLRRRMFSQWWLCDMSNTKLKILRYGQSSLDVLWRCTITSESPALQEIHFQIKFLYLKLETIFYFDVRRANERIGIPKWWQLMISGVQMA